MQKKKAFALAEILIVLLVVGLISALVVPSLMKGSFDAQIKTRYKKAYNAVYNYIAMEKLTGSLPVCKNQKETNRLIYGLSNALTVNSFTHQEMSAGIKATRNRHYSCAELLFPDGTIHTAGAKIDGQDCISSQYLPQRCKNDNTKSVGTPVWLISEDKIAYTVLMGTGISCSTKKVIEAQQTLADIIDKSCYVVVVDINGLSEGPNIIEPQTQRLLDSNKSMDILTGDQFQIYIGTDGATAGPKKTTATGRIVSDIK